MTTAEDGRPVREWRQTMVRLGDDLREQLIREAKAAERTLTAEIRIRLRQSLYDNTELTHDRHIGGKNNKNPTPSKSVA
jgi:hypothetical protein